MENGEQDHALREFVDQNGFIKVEAIHRPEAAESYETSDGLTYLRLVLGEQRNGFKWDMLVAYDSQEGELRVAKPVVDSQEVAQLRNTGWRHVHAFQDKQVLYRSNHFQWV